MGIGIASGPNRAVEAARQAIRSPLLEIDINGATDAIVQITSDVDITMSEVEEVINEIRNASTTEIDIIHGTGFNLDLQGEVVVTVIATGFDSTESREKRQVVENEADEIFVATANGIEKPAYEYKVEGGDTKMSYDNKKKEQAKDSKLPSWLQSRFK
jgi:cell division protein FtsZ